MGGSSGQQGPGSDEQALGQIASEAFSRQQAVYNPVIKKYSQVADNGALMADRLAGSANVSNQQAFSQATPGAVGTALRRGGSVSDTLGGVQAGKTQAQAAGQAGAVSSAKNVQLSELGQVIGFGRGQATQATSGLGQVAEQQTQQGIQNAELAANSRGQVGEAALGAAGLAYGGGAFNPATYTPTSSSQTESNVGTTPQGP